jgi:tetratricopeptide (TPR) repeat protein
MSNIEPEERKWLIKTSGKILGPLSFEEVVEDLRERNISMIDEVRSPHDRWMFIRENKKFAEVVQTLREQQANSKEDTSTTFVGTISKTITLDLTPPPVAPPVQAPRTTPTKASAPDVSDVSPTIVEKPNPASYGTNRDFRLQKRVEPARRRYAALGWLTLALVLTIGVFFQMNYHPESSKSLGFEDLIKLAKSNKSTGRYEKSLEFFRKAEAVRPLDAALQFQMAPLLMVVENQNLQARQILDGIYSKIADPKIKSEIESLIALSFLRESRLDEAQKRYQEIEKKNIANEPARINLVEISILQGHFDEATEKINELMKAGIKEPVLFLFRILTIYRTSQDQAKLEGAKSDLKRLLGQYQDYRSEMLLMLAAIQMKLNQKLDVGDSIKNLLNTDPDLTRKHVHDYFIHREVIEWNYLANICDILVKGDSEAALYQGLSAFCTYEQGDLKPALESLEKARRQFANDPSLGALHAALLLKAGRSSEAKALLQLPKMGDSDLAISVKASMCEAQKDWSCAEENWKRLLLNNSHDIGAFAGLSRIALVRGQIEQAQDYLKQGMLISRNYQPFLSLKDEINER